MRRLCTEAQLEKLSRSLACVLHKGDVIALYGDLGAGKTTFSRFLITALLGRAEEIPSPTFSLVQIYETPRMTISHFDLYRLSDASEAVELGFEEACADGLALIEWPSHAGELLPATRLDLALTETDDPDMRDVMLSGHGAWSARLARLEAREEFLETCGWGAADARYMQGDASTRAYVALERNTGGDISPAILMDSPPMPDGAPVRDGKPYSAIAHLAETVRPFVGVATALQAGGISVPEILCHDVEQGFLLLEDLGNKVFGVELLNDKTRGEIQSTLWTAAVDVLIAMRAVPVPKALTLPDGMSAPLGSYDQAALGIEAELLIDWYWRALKGKQIPTAIRNSYLDLWQPIFNRLQEGADHWVLRDYHSPNLLWLPERKGVANVGVIDFQDALRGQAAYDLVSLLQDARVDVPHSLEIKLFDHYCGKAAQNDPGFSRDEFSFAYGALGAQRNSKIVGIFARLAMRDHKPDYLRHIPRIWQYLTRSLEHPELSQLKGWYDEYFPPEIRSSGLEI